ncbi:DUF6153 family protein [Streptomyces sp. NPDC048604]|uniref:DUF6153 family protein n=1 Tax=Streptomyces sp. NPDC048604 TaxID=3365578 RepID=UPI003714B297
MILTARPTSRPRPAGRGLVLLVLVVLAGLLGMHALSPAQGAVRQGATDTVQAGQPSGPGHHGHQAAAGHHGAAQPSEARHATDETLSCSHSPGSGGHLQHADATCSAAGVSAPYSPPALAAALADLPVTAAAVGTPPASTVSGRAPPDLAELQLLRI